MKPTPEPKPGDPCPQCGGAFVDARQLTDVERKQLGDKENPPHFVGFVDTASTATVEEHGTLAKCQGCGYQTRFKAVAPPVADAPRQF